MRVILSGFWEAKLFLVTELDHLVGLVTEKASCLGHEKEPSKGHELKKLVLVFHAVNNG